MISFGTFILNGHFHEGHRMPLGRAPLFPGLMGILSIPVFHDDFLPRPCLHHISPNPLPELPHSDRWTDASPLGGGGNASSVWRLAQTLPSQEKRHAERETRKELLSM